MIKFLKKDLFHGKMELEIHQRIKHISHKVIAHLRLEEIILVMKVHTMKRGLRPI